MLIPTWGFMFHFENCRTVWCVPVCIAERIKSSHAFKINIYYTIKVSLCYPREEVHIAVCKMAALRVFLLLTLLFSLASPMPKTNHFLIETESNEDDSHKYHEHMNEQIGNGSYMKLGIYVITSFKSLAVKACFKML